MKIGVVRDNYAAIRSATSVAAQMNKLDAILGTLEAGKLADIVLVDGNPVEDIFALEKVTATWVEGKKLF